MISLQTLFWLMVVFFGLMGSLRGWTREVIATSGLVLSLFAINQFGALLISILGAAADPAALDPTSLRRQQFYILAITHLIITFFSYQGPAIAGSRLSDRLRIRDSLQDKILGFLIGSINGYLIVGTLLVFLEYQIIASSEWLRLGADQTYPFAENILVRPGPELDLFLSRMPLPFLAPYLPFLVVLVFLFVIVVMI